MGSARRALQRGSGQQQSGAEPVPAPPGEVTHEKKASRREGSKRITVDLPRDEHKFLRDFAYDNDTDGMRVVRALLMELRENSELADKVLRRLPDTEL